MKNYQNFINKLTEDFSGMSSVEGLGNPIDNFPDHKEDENSDDPFLRDGAPILNLYDNGDGFRINDNSKLYEVIKLFKDMTDKHLFFQNVSYAIDVNKKCIVFDIVTDNDHVMTVDILHTFVDNLKAQIEKRFGKSFEFEIQNKDDNDILGNINDGGSGVWQGKKELVFIVKEKGKEKEVKDSEKAFQGKDIVKESVKLDKWDEKAIKDKKYYKVVIPKEKGEPLYTKSFEAAKEMVKEYGKGTKVINLEKYIKESVETVNKLKTFIKKYPNEWHSFAKDKVTENDVKELEKEGILKVDWNTRQFFYDSKKEIEESVEEQEKIKVIGDWRINFETKSLENLKTGYGENFVVYEKERMYKVGVHGPLNLVAYDNPEKIPTKVKEIIEKYYKQKYSKEDIKESVEPDHYITISTGLAQQEGKVGKTYGIIYKGSSLMATTTDKERALKVWKKYFKDEEPKYWNGDKSKFQNFEESVNEEDYQILDHGIESEQYFQGCGTFGTKFDDCFTGIGESAYDALDDALEQAAMSDYDVDGIPNDLSKDKIEREEDSDGDERHYYVSIRLKKADKLEEDYIAKAFRLFKEAKEVQDTIIQGYIPTITTSKEKLFVAFKSGELTKDYLQGYLVSNKERALDIAKRYISNSGYDGIPGADAVNGKNEIIKEAKEVKDTDAAISKIPYTIKDFDITQDKPKDAIYFYQLKDKLIYSFESKDGNISANIFWTNPKGIRGTKGSKDGKFVDLEMRGMVGKYGILNSHYPLWQENHKIPSANEMIDSVIKSVKRKEY